MQTTSARDLATSAQDMVTSAQDLATSAPGLAVGTTSSSSASESSSAISSQTLSRRTGRCHLAERFVATCHAPLQLPCMQRAMRRAMQRAMHRAACRATRNKRRVCASICACTQMHMHAIGHWLGLYGVVGIGVGRGWRRTPSVGCAKQWSRPNSGPNWWRVKPRPRAESSAL
jgi:hypothetical protein